MKCSEAGQAPVKVLLLDAEPMVISALTAFFDLETDYDVVGVCCPFQALAYLRDHPTDVLIADLQVPAMREEDFVRAAREISEDLPVVLLSGCIEEPTAEVVNGLRPVCCLPKPWSNVELWSKIEAVIKMGRRCLSPSNDKS